MAWYENSEGQPQNDLLEEIPENAFTKPFPSSLWRIDTSFNDGLPYHEILEDVSGADIWSLPPENRLKVYSMWEKQDGFKSNGLAVLDPISCTSHHEFGGRWDVTFTHPLDDWGKWRFLVPQNILKVNGQLFRIGLEQPKINTSERTVTVTASHIFYDLNRDILLLKTCGNVSPTAFLEWVMANGTFYPFRNSPEYSSYNIYEFDFNTDISGISADVGEFVNVTLTASLIGENNCFVNLFGGELYRNNFYFSLNKRMENARDNAFFLRYSADLSEIEMSADFSNFATNVQFIDMNGEWCGASWWTDQTTAVTDVTAVPFVRAVKLSVPFSEQIQDKYFYQNAYPKYSYRIKLANIRNDPKYKDFANLQNLNVGDKGTVYCEPLGIKTEQMVTCIERDELTGEYTSVTLGSLSDSLSRPNQFSGVVTSGNSATDRQIQALQSELKNEKLRSLRTWGGAKSFKWNEVSNFTWSEVRKYE